MPEDIPKAIMVLVWLLTGIIVFGWLLMEQALIFPFGFALFFFGLPVMFYKKMTNKKV